MFLACTLIESVCLTEVIDLTHDIPHDNKDDIQAAIALSLLESPKIPSDGRDLNRCLIYCLGFSL